MSSSLTKLVRAERQFNSSEERRFDEGDVREAFEKVYCPGRDYVLFQTVASEEAVEMLRECVMPEEYSRPTHVSVDDDNELEFGNGLMDAYRRAIDEIAGRRMDEDSFARYSLVATDGVHNSDRDLEAIFWPDVYIVEAEKYEELRGIIEGLWDNESFEVLKEQESPHFYEMGEIATLYELRIAPIVCLDDELRVGGEELLKYVDFLAQMRDVSRWRGSSIDDD
jgi:hypothetical protein